MFGQRMVTPAIPERVYVLCRIVRSSNNHYISDKDLRERMEPSFLGNNSSYYHDYLTAATELRLVQVVDGMVSLAVEPSTVDSMTSLRKHCNGIIREFSGGQFFETTKAYFNLGINVLTGPNNVAEWGGRFKDEAGLTINNMELRAWRFWFTYLGFGYLHDMFLLPSAGTFIKDVIDIAGMEKKRRYSFGEFIDLVRPYAEIVLGEEGGTLNFGLSNGLRSLHDSGVITLEHIYDQEDIWSLYPMQLYSNDATVTNITLNK